MGFSFGFGDTFVVSNGGLFINFGGVNPPSSATVLNGTIVPPVIPNPVFDSNVGGGGSSGSLSIGSSQTDFPDITGSNRNPSLENLTFSSGVASDRNSREAQTLELSLSENEVMRISIEPVVEDVIGNDEAGNPTLIGQQVVGERFVSQGTSPTPSQQLPPNFLSNLFTKIFSGIDRS